MHSLGIDIGYSSIKFLLIDEKMEVQYSTYVLHKGRVKEEIDKNIKQLTSKYGNSIRYGAATGQGSKFISEKYGLSWINEVTSLVEGSKQVNCDIGSIVEIGGQSSKFLTNISDSDNSNILISINSNCSAGTGSFIEEQVSRLGVNLESYSNLTQNATFIPRIAGRCSVFAKTDIIHHQQEGVDSKDILLGLAYALVKNYRANVVKKYPIRTPLLLTGGVIYNESIVKALIDVLKLNNEDVIIPKDCGNISALGAAIIGLKDNLSIDLTSFVNLSLENERLLASFDNTVILSSLSQYGSNDSSNKHNCKAIGSEGAVSGYIGIDIGSTSTNVVFMDENNDVISFKYLRTRGNPIKVVTQGLQEIQNDLGKRINVLGVGTTGSGRYMIGKFVGADVIIDEITAQAKAANFIDPEVDTIIEIGGQDSKFIKLENGVVSDFEMNKICAAGTGSFIEEQALKLNIPINDFGDLAMKSKSPIDLGDRCTVFIETNIAASLSNEAKLEDIAAGLAYSIAKNYLNKIVGNKVVGNKILFQGGVAYNQAVINAFKAILGEKLEIPKFFSVTGAYGAAILAKEDMKGQSSFRGFDLDENVVYEKERKHEIVKEAKRTEIFEEFERLYLEGYDPKIDPSKKTVGIPRVLFLHKLFPLFNTYFKELGFNVILSDNSSEKTVELSQEYSMDETCYPIKLINGHIAELIEKKVDYIFLPSLYTMSHSVSTTRQDYGCVYMQCVPKLIDKTMDLERKGIKLLSPELSFKFGKKYLMKTLMELGKQLGKNPIRTGLALTKGMKSLRRFELKVEKQGEEVVSSLGKDEKAFVIVTRGYGIVDPILNMGIPEKLEKLGYKVLTLSNLPAHDHDTSKEHPNMYWPFGQHILSGAQIIKQHPNLYPIYITNHGCGPDTALVHYFKEEMSGKPYLNIEVDEHFSSVGVLTRVEAFVNSIKSDKGEGANDLTLKDYSNKVTHKPTYIKNNLDEIDKNTKLYLPFLHPYSEILAASLQGKGYDVHVLPMTTGKTLDVGRKNTLTKEYLSFTSILGDVLSKGLESNEQNQNIGFIIPTCEGSEIGGQYNRLLRDKLDNGNMQNAEIVAPFIEDVIKDRQLSEQIFLLLLGGDLVNLLQRNRREEYVNKIIGLIKNNKLTIDSLQDIANEISKELKSNTNTSKLFVMGEASIIFNDFLNNNRFKALEEKGINLLFAPLSEYMWFLWRDYLAHNKTQKADELLDNLTTLSNYMKVISNILEPINIFEKDMNDLVRRADEGLGLYTGGNGRYRYAKTLGNLDFVNGVITVSSMYENTNTILNILTQDQKRLSKIPILNMTFDGNENEIDNSKIDSFIYYAMK